MGSADAARLQAGFDIHYLAVFLVALGLFSIIFSTVHYVRTNRKIDREEELPFRDLAMPLMMSVLLLVFGAVLLFPSRRSDPLPSNYDAEFRQALRASPAQTLGDVKRRFQTLDARLAKLERYVTSSRFDLDQEFRKL